MSAPHTTTIDPAEVGFDPDALAALRVKIDQQIAEGRMPSGQYAFAVDGELAVFEAFGDATTSTRFNVFSATKALIAGVVWQLIGEGRLDPSTRVIEVIDDFGVDGRTPDAMASITLEQLLTHTGGFAFAPLGPDRWADRDARRAAYRRWFATTEPGSTFTYHPLAAHWIAAEMIEQLDGRDYRESVRERIIDPLGLHSFGLGVPEDAQSDIAELSIVGDSPTYEELAAVFGDFDTSLLDAVSPTNLLEFNRPEVRAVGVPGGGGIGTAADLALYYQALLHNTGELWKPDVLADGTGNIRCSLPDQMKGVSSNRSLGLIIAGDDGMGALRGMGPTVSARTFGHNGAAGQIVWADPDTGVSFALTTSGIDPHYLREGRRIASLGAKAGVCRPPS